jgi:hypothetical protein
MVKFTFIGMENERGQVAMFNTLDSFDKFRKNLWVGQPSNVPLLLEWVAQNSLERGLEKRFNLTSRLLDGLCLIFGTRQELAERLTHPQTQAVLLNPATEVSLLISTPDSQVHSKTFLGEQSYHFAYPLEQLLIPSGTLIFQKYFEFSAQKSVDSIKGKAINDN